MKLKVGTVQLRAERGQLEANLKRAEGLLRECVAQGAELIVLPELFDTGYFWGEELPRMIAQSHGRTLEWLVTQARDQELVLVAGLGISEPAEEGTLYFYDAAAVIGPTGQLALYRKTHLFRREREYFHAGEQLLVTEVELAQAPSRNKPKLKLKLGVLICVEVGFPELARALALEGAELIAIPMAFGAARHNIYEVATRARALENHLFLVTANQVGRSRTGEDDFDFYGHSRIIDPLGLVRLDLGLEEGCGVVELDLELARRCRRGELDQAYPYLRERRAELYRPLVE